MSLQVRGFREEDYEAVSELDDLSGNMLADSYYGCLNPGDTSAYGWGLFLDDKLIGCCSIGWADDVGEPISNHPHYNDSCDQLLLSDVFILPEYRNKGFGLYMIGEALKEKWEIEGKEATYAYLTLLYDELGYFYHKLGFEWCDDAEGYAMALDLNNLMRFDEPSL